MQPFHEFIKKMLIQKIIYLLVIVCIFPTKITTHSHKNSASLKPVNHTQYSHSQSIKAQYKPNEINYANHKCKYKCITPNGLPTIFRGRAQARFIDQLTNDTMADNEMETPAAKFSILNLLSDDEEGKEDYDNSNDDESLIDEELEDDDNYDEFNFFGQEEEISANKPEGTKEESFLKQYHRHSFRMHHWVFPLLLAYKLKFFMVIPFLLGSLVLLIGTTAIAGFFFALFAAALGIHVKTHEH